jgi:repressor LexA
MSAGGGIGLTQRQHDCLVYLTGHPDASYREIADSLGLANKSGACRHVYSLEERGYIRRLRNRARAIKVLKPAPVIINGERFRFIQIGRA